MSFDAAAPAFERYRSLPEEVPEAIRSAVLSHIARQRPRILDIGAGTGRIGRAFVNAGDNYVGLDLSMPMLREFQSVNAMLVQADAEGLPFSDRTFDAVLLIQVVSGARDWTRILVEARRVLAIGAPLLVGYIARPKDGVDLQLREHLDSILLRRGLPPGQKMQTRQHVLDCLESASRLAEHSVVASWTSSCTPQRFLERHQTGARFAALPERIRWSALDELSAWAEDRFGSLESVFQEEHSFHLHAFTF
jgi:ubiquinone/menaquinone biosynthesis C-methylase UbiE